MLLSHLSFVIQSVSLILCVRCQRGRPKTWWPTRTWRWCLARTCCGPRARRPSPPWATSTHAPCCSSADTRNCLWSKQQVDSSVQWLSLEKSTLNLGICNQGILKGKYGALSTSTIVRARQQAVHLCKYKDPQLWSLNKHNNVLIMMC